MLHFYFTSLHLYFSHFFISMLAFYLISLHLHFYFTSLHLYFPLASWHSNLISLHLHFFISMLAFYLTSLHLYFSHFPLASWHSISFHFICKISLACWHSISFHFICKWPLMDQCSLAAASRACASFCSGFLGQKCMQKCVFGARGILWTHLKESNARANVLGA